MTYKEQFALTFAIALGGLLFVPLLSGQPLWDDLPNWFFDHAVRVSSYQEILTSYAWPLTFSVQKFLFSVWGHRYRNYHAFSIFLHLVNSLMVFHLLRKKGGVRAWFVFLLFMIHPASVIAVGWMIQMKTLLCFFFAALAFEFYCFRHYLAGKVFAVIFLILSLAAKSASLPLALLLFIFRGKGAVIRKHWIAIALGGLVCFFAAVKIMSSELVQESGRQAHHAHSIQKAPPTFAEEILNVRPKLILRTIRYYFLESQLPIDQAPVKDIDLDEEIVWDILALVFIIALFRFTTGESRNYYLAGFVMLLPFLGFIPAPYMNHTLVADQHLYLALPFFLLGLFHLPFPNNSWRILLCAILLPYYLATTHASLSFYEDDETFYSSVLERYPNHLSMALNLSSFYLSRKKPERALILIEEMEKKAEKNERMRKNRYFADIINFKKQYVLPALIKDSPSMDRSGY